MTINKAEEVEKVIVELIESDKSANEISRRADVPLSTISRIRSGKTQIDNLTLTNVKKLYTYAATTK